MKTISQGGGGEGNRASFVHGPIVLAAATGKKDLELVPFFSLHDARYMLYRQVAQPDDLEQMQRVIHEREEKRWALQKQTVDVVSSGKQQPESEHNYQGEDNWITSKDEKVEAINWLRHHDISIRGHTLVWPGWNNLPDDLEANQNNLPYLRDRVVDHLEDILTYPGWTTSYHLRIVDIRGSEVCALEDQTGALEIPIRFDPGLYQVILIIDGQVVTKPVVVF